MIKAFAHKITSAFLVVILFVHNINTLVVIGDFISNQDFIAKTFCIQKENQQGCNGKCHLSKQLAENNSESNSNFPSKENKRIALDIYCLFITDIKNTNQIEFTLPRVNLILDSSKIVKTSFEVETPPPILS